MPRRRPDAGLQQIERILDGHAASGLTARHIAEALPEPLPLRTLQYRLKHLVDAGRLVRQGTGRWAVYRLPPITGQASVILEDARLEATGRAGPFLSPASIEIRAYLKQPYERRKSVSYDRQFLESYKPNASFYLSPAERAHLAQIGRVDGGTSQAAGTYATRLLGRLLIDLSWNSSRLEGNTYSLLDTTRLIEDGEEAEGRDPSETQMIINHKDAIEFLVNEIDDIGFNRYTILNLHAVLAENLLDDAAAAGRLRHIPVGIKKSAFRPLDTPQIIEECFDRILDKAAAIEDPFEQAFFIMAQLPYLQPFDDVNKRVSRLAANIPFIKRNLSPIAFIDVSRNNYTDALLGVYELRKIDLLKDIFIWAYERSARRYADVRQSLGEPDPFRLKHRAALRQIVSGVVRGRMNKKEARPYIHSWTSANMSEGERERFNEIAESELLGLHEGNLARYRLRPAEFTAWRQVWTKAS